MAGLFAAFGIIVFNQLIGSGANSLGFTEWTFRYYMLCLGACLALLVCSKPARKYGIFMMLFGVAVFMVIGIGFHSFLEVSSSQDQLAQVQENLMATGMLAAKVVMYVAPGALTAFYAWIAFGGVTNASARKPLS